MKKLFSIILMMAVYFTSHAQLSTQLTLQANPTASLSAWASTPQVLTLLILNATPQGIAKEFKIKTTIKTSNGEVVAVTDLTKAGKQSILGTSAIFNASVAVPMEFMLFNGTYKSTIQRTGKLPSGTYQLCVQLVNPIDYAVITPEQCKVFNLAALQLPFLVSPAPESSIEKSIAQTAITFRWTPLVPRPAQSIVSYRIQVFEVLENQKPMQAFRTNMPLLDKMVVGTTQYIWQPQLSFIDTNIENDSVATEGLEKQKTATVKTFIWTIQTFTKDGATGIDQPVDDGNINGDGRSQPELFKIKISIFKPHSCAPYRTVVGPFDLCKDLNAANFCNAKMCKGGTAFTSLTNFMLQNPAINFGFTFGANQTINIATQNDVLKAAKDWAIANTPIGYNIFHINFSPNVVTANGQSTSFITIEVKYYKCKSVVLPT